MTYRKIFLGGLLILILLLIRNPFSENNIISNLEPFPDTIHYLNASYNLIHGNGFKIIREGRTLNPDVPPLYSLILAPAFLFQNDPRLFYLINSFLALVSATLFFKILKNLFSDKYIIGLIFFLFVTDYIIYAYPMFPMAENLILPLLLFSILLLIKKMNVFSLFFAGIVITSFYATKYVCFPLSLIFLFLFTLKILFIKENVQRKALYSLLLTTSALVPFIILTIFESLNKGVNTLSYLNHFTAFISTSKTTIETTATSKYFSYHNFDNNFIQYLAGLAGGPIQLLNFNITMVPFFVGILGLPALIIGLIRKQTRFISFSFLLLIILFLLAISDFYSFDARYIFYMAPILLLAFGILLTEAKKFLDKNDPKPLFYIGIAILLLVYLFAFGKQLIKDSTNGDKAWNYIYVSTMNGYFTNEKITNFKKPILISVLPPYYIDYFSNNNYSILPLFQNLAFSGSKEALDIVYGQNDYSDLPKLFRNYLNQGYSVYVSNYGMNSFAIYDARRLGIEKLKEKFNLTEVENGCYGYCNIYQLEHY